MQHERLVRITNYSPTYSTLEHKFNGYILQRANARTGQIQMHMKHSLHRHSFQFQISQALLALATRITRHVPNWRTASDAVQFGNACNSPGGGSYLVLLR